jgi:hypothetical protein
LKDERGKLLDFFPLSLGVKKWKKKYHQPFHFCEYNETQFLLLKWFFFKSDRREDLLL